MFFLCVCVRVRVCVCVVCACVRALISSLFLSYTPSCPVIFLNRSINLLNPTWYGDASLWARRPCEINRSLCSRTLLVLQTKLSLMVIIVSFVKKRKKWIAVVKVKVTIKVMKCTVVQNGLLYFLHGQGHSQGLLLSQYDCRLNYIIFYFFSFFFFVFFLRSKCRRERKKASK